MSEPPIRIAPYDYAEASAISRELEVPEQIAAILVRRGFRTPEAAREFLAADEWHPPTAFAGMNEAVAAIHAAIEAGRLITVHGDYDVDGTTSTAILVRAIRALGAQCDWLIPGRVEDGYGLSSKTIERLAARGTELMITVDCGIASAAEVAEAREAGIDVVVTDHHQPGAELPGCPIVHPVVSEYPCPDLCAAGVAYKLACALRGEEECVADLDLVGLATVADMVPLTGENRTLVRRGLERARRAPRPGLRALMRVAGVAPERVDETDFGFRLAPRINAAGRLYRADGAVELFLTGDEARAAEIAAELDRANLDRREAESEVLAEANGMFAALEEAEGEQPAVVLWGEGWHPGVVGICASRMAERHHRPAVLIALDGDRGKGSGRSVQGFDLLAGLRECAEVLDRFGGHRAAAGLEIERDRLSAFRATFNAHVAESIAGGPQVAAEEVDAVVGSDALGHELATALDRLGPFGVGNPRPRLVVPSARIKDVRPMGETGRHARFSLVSGGGRAGGVAFGVGQTLERRTGGDAFDVTVKLELNQWNGAVEPRVVLAEVHDRSEPNSADWTCEADEYAERLEAELARGPGLPEPAAALGVAREVVDRREQSALAATAALVSSGEPVLLVCADALWRRGIAEVAADPRRYAGRPAALIASRGSIARGVATAEGVAESGGLVVADWAALALRPDIAMKFPHVAVADPAPHPSLEAIVAARAAGGRGHMHRLAGGPELSMRALALWLPLRDELASTFQAIRAVGARDGTVTTASLQQAMDAEPGAARSPEAVARTVRILGEMGVVQPLDGAVARGWEVVSSVRGSLSDSASFHVQEVANEECARSLSEPKKPSSTSLKAAA